MPPLSPQVLSITLRTMGLPPNAGPNELKAAGVSEAEVVGRLRYLRKQVVLTVAFAALLLPSDICFLGKCLDCRGPLQMFH